MRIFLSHSSRDKPLLREIMKYLPHHVLTWFDDKDLRFGEKLYTSIRRAIDIETDFVILFISPEAVRSQWVQRELQWAITREYEIGRVFILPVVLDKESWRQLPADIQSKRYLPCTDFSESGVRKFADHLSNELFAWISRMSESTKDMDPGLEKEDLRSRREIIKTLSTKITDNQDECREDQCLTKERLNFIVSGLDSQRKLQLLILYEFMRGNFKDQYDNVEWEEVDLIEVDFRLSGGEVWSRIFDFTPLTFEHLRNDYGLGDNKYLVRNVFLDGIAKLSEKERRVLFSGVEVTNFSFRR